MRRAFHRLLGGATSRAARGQTRSRVRAGGSVCGWACRERHGEQPGSRRCPRGTPKARVEEGRNIEIDTRWTTPSDAGIRKELVALQPEFILTSSTPATDSNEAQQTSTIPIIVVMVSVLSAAFSRELARPGGNVPAFTAIEARWGGKWVELLKENRARSPGALRFKPANGDICRILPAPLQSRRCVPRRGGDRAPVSDSSELEYVGTTRHASRKWLIRMPDALIHRPWRGDTSPHPPTPPVHWGCSLCVPPCLLVPFSSLSSRWMIS